MKPVVALVGFVGLIGLVGLVGFVGLVGLVGIGLEGEGDGGEISAGAKTCCSRP